MEKIYRVRIYYERDLIAKWRVNEKQKQIIEGLVDANLFYEEVNFEIEEEKEEQYKDFT